MDPVHLKVDDIGLVVCVDPELGMRSGRDKRVMKLWLSKDGPSETILQVYHGLMIMARIAHKGWERTWAVETLNVQGEKALMPRANVDMQAFNRSLQQWGKEFLTFYRHYVQERQAARVP